MLEIEVLDRHAGLIDLCFFPIAFQKIVLSSDKNIILNTFSKVS